MRCETFDVFIRRISSGNFTYEIFDENGNGVHSGFAFNGFGDDFEALENATLNALNFFKYVCCVTKFVFHYDLQSNKKEQRKNKTKMAENFYSEKDHDIAMIRNLVEQMRREDLVEEFIKLGIKDMARTDKLENLFHQIVEKYGKSPELRRLWNVIQWREPDDNGVYFTQEDAEEWGVEWHDPDGDIEDAEKMSSKDPIQHILFDIKKELEKAKKKHPFFPLDAVRRCSIMMEEAGEAVQAANDIVWGDIDDTANLKTELLQTAAMCVRILEAMENKES